MKRIALIALAVASLGGVSSLAAQKPTFGIGIGALLPMGDYADADNMGFVGGAGVTFPVGPIGIRVDAGYGQTTHKDQGGVAVDGNTKIFGGNVDAVYKFAGGGSLMPYVFGGLGYYNVKVDVTVTGFGSASASESKIGYNLGGGVNISSFFVEARYVSVSTSGSATTFLPIIVGYRF